MKYLPTTIKGWLPVLVAILAVCGITVSITQGDHSTTVNVTVQTPTGPTTVTASAGAVDAAASGDHNSLNGSPTVCTGAVTTDCVSPAQFAAGNKQVAARQGTLPFSPLPNTATSMPGCSTRFLKTNYSSRNGVAPDGITWHQTDSPDSSWAGINGNIAWFSNPGAQVSIHFIIDGRYGRCSYTLPMALKAWQVVGFNSRMIGIEVTGTQTQGYYVKGAARTRLEILTARIAHAWRIPIRRERISGCTVARNGIGDHTQLGACGGGHDDINPYRGQIAGLIAGTKRWYAKLYGNKTTKRCDELKRLRQRAHWRKSHGHSPVWLKSRTHRARTLKHVLGSKEKSCR